MRSRFDGHSRRAFGGGDIDEDWDGIYWAHVRYNEGADNAATDWTLQPVRWFTPTYISRNGSNTNRFDIPAGNFRMTYVHGAIHYNPAYLPVGDSAHAWAIHLGTAFDNVKYVRVPTAGDGYYPGYPYVVGEPPGVAVVNQLTSESAVEAAMVGIGTLDIIHPGGALGLLLTMAADLAAPNTIDTEQPLYSLTPLP